MARVEPIQALEQFAREQRFFRAGAPVIYRAAHGGLDVLGALNAESGGTLAQMTLPAQVAVGLQIRDEPMLHIQSTRLTTPGGASDAREPPVSISLGVGGADWNLPEWAAAILALWSHLDIGARGAAIFIHGNVPVGAGQGASTAMLAALASALLSLPASQGTTASPLAVAQAVATVKARLAHGPAAFIVPSRMHLIKAMTAMNPRGSRPHLLRYSAQPCRLVGPVPLPANIRVLALDTGIRAADLSAGEDAHRTAIDELRVAAAMALRIIETIYRDLGQHHTPLHGYLANMSPLLYRQYFRALLPRRLRGSDFTRTYGPLPEELFPQAAADLDAAKIYRVRTAADHLIAEHEHSEQFLQAMEELADAEAAEVAGIGRKNAADARAEHQLTLARAGRLLLASHHSYRLRLELSYRHADWLVDRLMEAGPEAGIYGARITGEGGATLAALLDRSPRATDALLHIMTTYNQQTGRTLGITEG